VPLDPSQIIRARIEGIDFTLYYDYDQLRDGKITRLTDEGKIEWFRLRMEFVFLEPLKCLYGGKTPAHRALNSTKSNDLPARSFVIPTFALLLNGIESLGSSLTSSKSNKERFLSFIRTYMKRWNGKVRDSPYVTTSDLGQILWIHFRNAITHGFCIERGGIDNEADSMPGGFLVKNGHIVVGPHAFFHDFLEGINAFFRDARTKNRRNFLQRFSRVYRH
jgi:hypothetical protein